MCILQDVVSRIVMDSTQKWHGDAKDSLPNLHIGLHLQGWAGGKMDTVI